MKIENTVLFQKLTRSMQQRIMAASKQLCPRISYKFSNLDLFVEALTHSSAAQELFRKRKCQIPWNERLEFLGDSILSLVLSTYLLNRPDCFEEGSLSKIRAALVNEASLARLASRIDLGQYLLLSVGEDRSGGRTKHSVLADGLEALLGAIYLDSGYEAAQTVILGLYQDILVQPLTELVQEDYKSRLQELTQGSFKDVPNYEVIDQTGPDHNLFFSVAVKFKGLSLAVGKGSNKKKASQEAARAALLRLKKEPQLLAQRTEQFHELTQGIS